MRSLALPPLLLILIGAVVAALFDSTAAQALGIFLIGVGCVVAVSAMFWHIGRSEEREREDR